MPNPKPPSNLAVGLSALALLAFLVYTAPSHGGTARTAFGLLKGTPPHVVL